MRPEVFLDNALIPALQLLPAKMDSPAARAMCISIPLQESRLTHRRQIGGPARSYFQMEQGGGVHGVLTHPATKPIILPILAAMDYPNAQEFDCWTAIEHNDILACCFGRLLLYTLPDALPAKGETQKAWGQYISAWRPGAPKPLTWPDLYEQAWSLFA